MIKDSCMNPHKVVETSINKNRKYRSFALVNNSVLAEGMDSLKDIISI